MRIDVNTFLGSYPWRHVPGTSLADLRESVRILQIDEAWVSHLPALFWKDPMAGNGWLVDTVDKSDGTPAGTGGPSRSPTPIATRSSRCTRIGADRFVFGCEYEV